MFPARIGIIWSSDYTISKDRRKAHRSHWVAYMPFSQSALWVVSENLYVIYEIPAFIFRSALYATYALFGILCADKIMIEPFQ